MGLPVARLGDGCSHGATIITASTTRTVTNQPVARLGDLVNCPIHGVNPIVSLQNVPETDNQLTAHLNGVAQCGATIVTGSTDTEVGPS